MTEIHLPDLHPVRLRSRLTQDLARAHADKLLDASQYGRLQALFSGRPDTRLRLSRVTLADHPDTYADAFVIHDGPLHYLHTPLQGFERFTQRSALNAALLERAGLTAADAVLEEESVTGDPFIQQAHRLLGTRVKALHDFDQQLRALPDLSSVLLDAFRQKLGLLEATLIDQPAQLLLQHVEGTTVRRTLPLPQQLVEHYHQTELPPGQRRRWLTPNGQPFAADSAQVLEHALVSPADDLHGNVERLLAEHWGSGGRRNQLCRALMRNFEHTLGRQRNDASLTREHALWLSAALTQQLPLETVTLSDGIQPDLPLAAFRVLRKSPSASEGYLYSAAHGFEAFDSLEALNSRFQALNHAARVPAGLTPDDQLTFLSMDQLYVTLGTASPLGFSHWADALIRWQVGSIQRAMPTYTRQALDIRALVDVRLPAYQADEAMADLAPVSDSAWLSRLNNLQARLLAWQQQQPTLHDCARTLLDQHLAVLTWPCLKAATLLVQTTVPDTTQARTRPLTDLLLERVSGATPLTAESYRARLILADGQRSPGPAPQFDTQLLESLLEHTSALLRSRYQEACHLPRPGLYEVYEQALRVEARSLRELLDDTPAVVDGLDQALNLPKAAARHAVGTGNVQVHAITLSVDHGAPVILEGTFVIHDAGAASGPLLLWSPATGLQYLPSLAALKTRLLADLHSADHREGVLSLIAEAHRVQLRNGLADIPLPNLRVQPQVIDDNLIQALLDSRQRWVQSATDCAWTLAEQGRFEAPLFNDLMRYSLQAQPVQPDLRGLTDSLLNAELQSALPEWAQNVSPDQLQRYATLLFDCLEAQRPENYYLNGIAGLKQFALHKLQEAVERSHGPLSLDLEQVLITFKTYDALPPLAGNTPSGAPSITHATTISLLTSALSQFGGQQSGVASVTLADGSTPPVWLTPDYLSTLVKELDVGQQYRAMLAGVLNPQDARYKQRGELFGLSLRAQLREQALRMHLQGKLSLTACDYLECVLSMPDDLARQPLDGQDIVLRQVRLVAQAGMKPDAVAGMYMIGPRNTELGPVVLLAPYSLEFGLKEYDNSAAFLQQARTSDALAALIVWRLEDEARPRYDHGGLQEPHLPWSVESDFDFPIFTPAAPELDTDTVIGNALDFLFEDNLHLVQMMARRQTVSRAEAQWQAFITLATLGLEQGSLFLPGELAVMVNAWQSQLMLKSSANSAAQKRWGQALAEFCAALSNLAGHRRAVAAEHPVRPHWVAPKPPSPPPPEPTPTTEFGWRQQNLPHDLKARLVPFEARFIALRELLKDPTTHLYSTAATSTRYAAITGKVYQVDRFQGHWYIVRGEERGPRVRLNSQQQWELDLQWGLRGGGSCLGTPEPDLAELQDHIDSLFETQAVGMPAIHERFSAQGQQLAAAHRKALGYVRTYLENLNSTQADQPLARKTLQILDDFFKAGPLTPALLMKLRTRGRQLFGALLEASLDPATSPRLIMGRSKFPHMRLIAFTMKDDPLRRIYLTERYFTVPNWMFQYTQAAGSGFEVTAHYQASTLIHELSHVVLDTQDIAYVESSVPYLDLLAGDTAQGKQLKADTERLQQRKLSLDAPPGELFTLPDNGQMADVSGRAAARILRITGRETLAEARDDFYTDPAKRLEIILNNADSMTLLITLLGRNRH